MQKSETFLYTNNKLFKKENSSFVIVAKTHSKILRNKFIPEFLKIKKY